LREFTLGSWFCLGSTALTHRKTFERVKSYPGKPTPFLDGAVRRLDERYLNSAFSEYLADREARRYIRAYLRLVKASALWHTGRKLSAVLLLLQSFASNPCVTLQNGRFHKAFPAEQAPLLFTEAN
jgi:hypothetical protein